MGKESLISVVTPVYHLEKYICATMDSVRAQTYTDWEYILVLDGEGDPTADVIREYIERTGDERIRLFESAEPIGAAGARNMGVELAAGRYIAYLDGDDIWEPEKLEKELALASSKGAGFVFTGYEFADENGVGSGKVVHVPESLTYEQALGNTVIFTSTVLFDTEIVDKSLIRMPNIKSEDTALWWTLLRKGYVAYGLDENLVKYRRIGKTLSSNKLAAVKRMWYLLRKHEGLGLGRSIKYFMRWAIGATRRRV